MNAAQLLGLALRAAKNSNQPPIKPGKSATTAFLAGFLFGPFGTGIYLGTTEDFMVPMGILIAATVFTGGIAAPLAWMFCGAWGAMRVNASQS